MAFSGLGCIWNLSVGATAPAFVCPGKGIFHDTAGTISCEYLPAGMYGAYRNFGSKSLEKDSHNKNVTLKRLCRRRRRSLQTGFLLIFSQIDCFCSCKPLKYDVGYYYSTKGEDCIMGENKRKKGEPIESKQIFKIMIYLTYIVSSVYLLKNII